VRRGWLSGPRGRKPGEGFVSRRNWLLFGAALALSLLAEFVLPITHEGEDHWWYHVPFFWAIFGFAGCVIIVLGSKWLGQTFLDRPEGYYDEEELELPENRPEELDRSAGADSGPGDPGGGGERR
jgi:hypothetical protein